MTARKKITHTAWAQYYERGKFVKWVEVGEGYFETDGQGRTFAHVFTNATVKGDNGYTLLAPKGAEPPAPPPDAPERN